MANIFPYALYSGDPIPVDLIFYDLIKDPTGGTVLDLTGSTVGLTVKVQPTDPDTAAIYQQDIVGDTTGQISFEVPGQPPGNYYLDCKMWSASNVRSNILQEQFQINQSVTSRTTPAP